MTRVQTTANSIRQIEFELDKAEHGLARSSTTAHRDVHYAPAAPLAMIWNTNPRTVIPDGDCSDGQQNFGGRVRPFSATGRGVEFGCGPAGLQAATNGDVNGNSGVPASM
jgi:hypothetical protein